MLQDRKRMLAGTTHAPCEVQWPHCSLEPQLPAQGCVQQAVAALERPGEHAAEGGQAGIWWVAYSGKCLGADLLGISNLD